ncbi:hypothetical protein GCM10027160_38280 [Streptomyces calidiresistens]
MPRSAAKFPPSPSDSAELVRGAVAGRTLGRSPVRPHDLPKWRAETARHFADCRAIVREGAGLVVAIPPRGEEKGRAALQGGATARLPPQDPSRSV